MPQVPDIKFTYTTPDDGRVDLRDLPPGSYFKFTRGGPALLRGQTTCSGGVSYTNLNTGTGHTIGQQFLVFHVVPVEFIFREV